MLLYNYAVSYLDHLVLKTDDISEASDLVGALNTNLRPNEEPAQLLSLIYDEGNYLYSPV